MTTATLTFELPEENNDLAMAIDAKDAFWALCQINDLVRDACDKGEMWVQDRKAKEFLQCILEMIEKTRATDLIE